MDTGADISIVSRRLYDTLRSKGVNEYQPSHLTKIEGVSGHAKVTGQIHMQFQIQHEWFNQDFTIIDGLNTDMILGVDFLNKYKAVINFSNQSVSLKDGQIEISLRQEDQGQKVRPLRSVRIAPRTEALITVVIGSSSQEPGVIEPAIHLLPRRQVMTARALVIPRRGQAVCKLRNPFNYPVTLHPRDVIGYYTPVREIHGQLNHSVPQVNTVKVEKSKTQAAIDLQEAQEIMTKLGISFEDSNITPDQKNRLIVFLAEHRNVFAKDMAELQATHLVKHHIDTGEHSPVASRPYRVSPAQKREIEKQVQQMLEHDVIKPSCSQWRSPVILVKKKNNTYRFAIDLRKLNSVSKPRFFPLPALEDALDILAGCKIFSTVDAFQGYWQIPLTEESQEKTTFTCHIGNFAFKRMCFGLQGAPATYQALMNHVLAGLTFQSCLVYVDDIIIMSKTFEEHLAHLRAVFERLKAANLKLKPGKCRFGKNKVEYLGHIISKEGLSVDPKKVQIIKDFPRPRTQTEVRSFLGCCNYYKKFCKNFAMIARPLNKLLMKDVSFAWTDETEDCFQNLKEILTTAPILAFPDFDRQFIVYTDASHTAIGYILGQRDERGKERVVAYGGRALRGAELRYTITEKETLALVEACKTYRPYLLNSKFLVYTDHTATKFLQNVRDPTGRLARWALTLQAFSYDIVHKPGRTHSNADTLSRVPWEQGNRDERAPPSHNPPTYQLVTVNTTNIDKGTNTSKQNEDIQEVPVTTGKKETIVATHKEERDLLKDNQANNPQVELWTPIVYSIDTADNEEIRTVQLADNFCASMLKYLEKGELPSEEKVARRLMRESQDFVVTHTGTLHHLYYPRTKGVQAERVIRQLVVPEVLRNDILLAFHDSLLAGHFATERTYQAIRLRYYWPGMYTDIERYCRSCVPCQKAKRQIHVPKPELKPLPRGTLFSRWHVDLMGPLTTSTEGHQYILLFIEAFSRWPEIIPIKDSKAATIAKHLYEDIIVRFGAPDVLLSDRGSNFLSRVVQEVCKIFEITRVHTSAYHPQTNAACERTNSTLAQALRTLCEKKEKEWHKFLPGVAAALRTSPSTESTQFTPFFLLYKQECRMPIDTALTQPQDTNVSMENILKNAEITKQVAQESIKEAQQRYKKRYDEKCRRTTFAVGQKVMMKCSHNTPGITPKLQQKYQGPFYITSALDWDTFTLRRCADNQPVKSPVHAIRLKPFYSPESRPTNLHNLEPIQEDQEEQEKDGSSTQREDMQDAENEQTRETKETGDAPLPEMQKTDKGSQPKQTQDAARQEEETFLVEKLLKSKRINGQPHYLIKWQGYPMKEATWEPMKNIPQELMQRFHVERTLQGKRRKQNNRKHTLKR